MQTSWIKASEVKEQHKKNAELAAVLFEENDFEDDDVNKKLRVHQSMVAPANEVLRFLKDEMGKEKKFLCYFENWEFSCTKPDKLLRKYGGMRYYDVDKNAVFSISKLNMHRIFDDDEGRWVYSFLGVPKGVEDSEEKIALDLYEKVEMTQHSEDDVFEGIKCCNQKKGVVMYEEDGNIVDPEEFWKSYYVLSSEQRKNWKPFDLYPDAILENSD